MKKMNNEAYESIKMEIIESCYKHNINYSEFMNMMMDELETIAAIEELAGEEWN